MVLGKAEVTFIYFANAKRFATEEYNKFYMKSDLGFYFKNIIYYMVYNSSRHTAA